MVGEFLGVEMPQPDGGNGRALLKVDLHPLEAVEQLNEVAFAGVLVAVGDEFEFTDDGGVVTTGDGFTLGEQRGALWDEKLGSLGGSLNEIRHIDWFWGAYDEFRRKLGDERNTADGATRRSRGIGGGFGFLAARGENEGGAGEEGGDDQLVFHTERCSAVNSMRCLLCADGFTQ